jgi:hypothetical protein
MKKLVLGCLAAFIIVAVAGGILGWFFVIQPARQYIAAFHQLGTLSDFDRQVKNTAAFTPPEAGELTEEMVTRFASVQDAMQTRLGAKMQQLQQQHERMSRSMEGSGPREAGAVFTALRDLAGVVTEAKRIQVDALNQMGFSVAEYQWVRDQVYRAAGTGFAQLDFKAIGDAAQKGDFQLEPQQKGGKGEVPEKNKALVKPYLDKIQQWITLAWMGL